MREDWKDIKYYEGKYQVSNLGRVKSLGNNKSKKEKILKPGKNKFGYLYVILSKEGIHKNFQLHRLVAQAFIENPNNYPIINHKDENKLNNKVDNLEWCTQKYNINYGTRTQRFSESSKGISRNKGSRHPRARKVKCITTGKKFNCIKEAAEYYEIQVQDISSCCRSKLKSAGKHPVTGEKLKWKYID